MVRVNSNRGGGGAEFVFPSLLYRMKHKINRGGGRHIIGLRSVPTRTKVPVPKGLPTAAPLLESRASGKC